MTASTGTDKLDIRANLHTLMGCLRQNRIIDAYDLLQKMSSQMDRDYYERKAMEQ